MAAMNDPRRRLGSERGAELIELAMVTPVLLMILAAIFDFGFMFRSWEVVTNAAREGARVGTLPSYSCDPAAPGGTQDVEDRVEAYMAAAGYPDPDTYDIVVDTGDVDTPGGTFTACLVRVSMDQPLASLSVVARVFGGDFSTVPVAANAVMRNEIQAVAPAP
jgi:hypothetical protein